MKTLVRNIDLNGKNHQIEISLATSDDRNIIYHLRYQVYSSELMQHPPNQASIIKDSLDDFNEYIVAKINTEIVGFISITPPDKNSYSIDKYFSREKIPFEMDAATFEMRILTVLEPYRGKPIAAALMWAAFRWIQTFGGEKIVAIGRSEVLDMYLKLGFKSTGIKINVG